MPFTASSFGLSIAQSFITYIVPFTASSFGLSIKHTEFYNIYMPFRASSFGLSIAHTEFYNHIYAFYSLFFWSVYSTYRGNLTCLCIYAFTDLNSASCTYVLELSWYALSKVSKAH